MNFYFLEILWRKSYYFIVFSICVSIAMQCERIGIFGSSDSRCCDRRERCCLSKCCAFYDSKQRFPDSKHVSKRISTIPLCFIYLLFFFLFLIFRSSKFPFFLSPFHLFVGFACVLRVASFAHTHTDCLRVRVSVCAVYVSAIFSTTTDTCHAMASVQRTHITNVWVSYIILYTKLFRRLFWCVVIVGCWHIRRRQRRRCAVKSPNRNIFFAE